MTESAPQTLVDGAKQSGLRDHNERLLLSMIRTLGSVPGSDLARRTTLSAQTVSVILRGLESDGLLTRGAPVRGKVGKPSTPMALNPDGALALGMKIGRRTADLGLMDLCGRLRHKLRLTYRYPRPDPIFDFVRDGLQILLSSLPAESADRVCGLGLATPFEIWNWSETLGAPEEQYAAWRDIDIAEEVRRLTPLPVYAMNDATAACRAEHHLGGDHPFADYLYFFVGAFIGGGIVLNGTVIDGNLGNAGALGPIVTFGRDGRPVQLLDCASLHQLERRVEDAGGDPELLWRQPHDWSAIEPELDQWIASAAQGIAQAAMLACAVIDFEGVVIDGAIPSSVRTRLTHAAATELESLDARGLIRPQVAEGRVGSDARVLGAAYAPISAQYFLGVPGGRAFS